MWIKKLSLLFVCLLLFLSFAFSLSEFETQIIGKLEGDLIPALSEIQSLKELLSTYKTQLTGLQTSLIESDNLIQSLEVLIQNLETEITNREKSLTELLIQRETLTSQSEELKADLLALSDMSDSLEREIKKYRTGFYISSGVALLAVVAAVIGFAR